MDQKSGLMILSLDYEVPTISHVSKAIPISQCVAFLMIGMQIPPMAVPVVSVFYFPRLLTSLSCKIKHCIGRGYVGHNAETIKVGTVGTDRSVCPV